MLRMNAFGRIALCGMIAGYDGQPVPMSYPAADPDQPHEGGGLHRQRAHGSLARGAHGTGHAGGHRQAAAARIGGPGHRSGARGVPGPAQGQELRQAAGQADLRPRGPAWTGDRAAARQSATPLRPGSATLSLVPPARPCRPAAVRSRTPRRATSARTEG